MYRKKKGEIEVFKLGQKVMIDNEPTLIGYIVKIEYDPLDEIEATMIDYTFYYIRVFKTFYKDGYFDFCRGEDAMTAV